MSPMSFVAAHVGARPRSPLISPIVDEALADQVRATPTAADATVLTFEELVPVVRAPASEARL